MSLFPLMLASIIIDFPHIMGTLNMLSGGGTPLCKQIRDVIAHIKGMEQSLRDNGQKVSLTIFTDGESSDGDIAKGTVLLILLL
jgi:hypothetical protein